ncbi:MAG: phosphoribosylformylglycinamidine synthase subunit PurS [Ignisphaera sp.]
MVEVVITNKRTVRDPEGETIHKHLILRKGFNSVKNVRAGRYLLFAVESETPEKALEIVKEICEKLRIYNPVVHDIEVRLRG